MKPAQFFYHAPRTVEEVLALKATVEDARIPAGRKSFSAPMPSRRMIPWSGR